MGHRWPWSDRNVLPLVLKAQELTDAIHDFCTASSSFYPSLARWFEDANYERLAKQVRRQTGTERDE